MKPPFVVLRRETLNFWIFCVNHARETNAELRDDNVNLSAANRKLAIRNAELSQLLDALQADYDRLIAGDADLDQVIDRLEDLASE